MLRNCFAVGVVAFFVTGCAGMEKGGGTKTSASPGPATGFTLHVQAPHMKADGTVGGPYHHYCKGINDEVIQCLLFKSTDPKAKLVGVEYFLAKDLVRKHVPLNHVEPSFS